MIVFAVETSGPYPALHGMVELAAVDYVRPERVFHERCFLQYRDKVNEKARQRGIENSHAYRLGRQPAHKLISHFTKWVARCQHKSLAGLDTRIELAFLEKVMPVARLFPEMLDLKARAYHDILRSCRTCSAGSYWQFRTEDAYAYAGIPAERDGDARSKAYLRTLAFAKLEGQRVDAPWVEEATAAFREEQDF